MDNNELAVKTFRLQNFKAVRDSGTVEFTPLTVFIGNNGSGKSSLIEGLEMIQLIVEKGLDRAMQQWHGFETIWNKSVPHLPVGTPDARKNDEAEDEDDAIPLNPSSDDESETYDPDALPPDEDIRQYDLVSGNVLPDLNPADQPEREEIPLRSYLSNPMAFRFTGVSPNIFSVNKYAYEAEIEVTTEVKTEKLMFRYERYKQLYPSNGSTEYERNATDDEIMKSLSSTEASEEQKAEVKPLGKVDEDTSIMNTRNFLPIGRELSELIPEWQFLLLDPTAMADPMPQKRTKGQVKLAKDGSNIAEYLKSILALDANAFNGIVETLKVILPYVGDLQTGLAAELERSVYLQLVEGEAKLPGWLFSTGTLRIVAILAVLRHPEPPPLLVIEELENGLDPTTIHLILEEINRVTTSGKTQVILTTHSPYLLDLLQLEQIVMVEREGGQPVFRRPAENFRLQKWAERFAPGRLYTMGRLGSERN